MDHADNLKSALKSIGWSQQRLADFLTDVTGDSIPLSRVQGWLAGRSARFKRTCPGWPLAMLRLAGHIDPE